MVVSDLDLDSVSQDAVMNCEVQFPDDTNEISLKPNRLMYLTHVLYGIFNN